MVCKNKKNPRNEDHNHNYNVSMLDSIIAQNNQLSNDLFYYFNKQKLNSITDKELMQLNYLSQEVPYKWCREKVKEEFNRRCV